jgi:hypothetical protein
MLDGGGMQQTQQNGVQQKETRASEGQCAATVTFGTSIDIDSSPFKGWTEAMDPASRLEFTITKYRHGRIGWERPVGAIVVDLMIIWKMLRIYCCRYNRSRKAKTLVPWMIMLDDVPAALSMVPM